MRLPSGENSAARAPMSRPTSRRLSMTAPRSSRWASQSSPVRRSCAWSKAARVKSTRRPSGETTGPVTIDSE